MKPYLFIDFYKTISFDKFWHLVSEPLLQQIEAFIFSEDTPANMADKWMRGEVTSEEVNKYVAENFDTEYELLWDLFVQSAKTLKVNKNALSLILSLRDTYTTVLITDNMDSLTRFTIPAQRLEAAFDKIVNSADVGIRKSDGTGDMFKLVTKDFSNCVLIDDTQHVCSSFVSLGGKAFKVIEESDTEKYLELLIASSK